MKNLGYITKIGLTSLMLLTLMSLTGCSSKNEYVQIDDKKSDLKDAPNWILLPRMDGKIVEIGSASKNNKNDLSFQRSQALADARDNLARSLYVKVENILKAYKSKNNENELYENHEHTSKQIVDVTISLSKQEGIWVTKSGVIYVLVGIDEDTFLLNVKKHLEQ